MSKKGKRDRRLPWWLNICMMLSILMVLLWILCWLRWDDTAYSREQLTPVTCTFQSYDIITGKGGAAIYLMDTQQRYYYFGGEEKPELNEGDTLQMLVTPYRRLCNRIIAELRVDGKVLYTYDEYCESRRISRMNQLGLTVLCGALTGFTLTALAVRAIRRCVQRNRRMRRKQENMRRLREQDLLHPKNQRRRGPKGKDKS